MHLIRNILILLTLSFVAACNTQEDDYELINKIFIPIQKAEKYIPSEANNSPIQAYTTAYSYLQKIGQDSMIKDESRATGEISDGNYTNKLIKKNTWEIYNNLGTGFVHGVAFTNIPKEINSLNLKIHFPEMILPSGKRVSSKERPINIAGHNGMYEWGFEYYFDEEFETVPGIWEFQIFSENELVYNSKFTVINH